MPQAEQGSGRCGVMDWGRGGSVGAADRPTAMICSSCPAPLVMKLKILISVSCSL